MIAALALALVVGAAISVPHLLPLNAVPPWTAAVVWSLAVALRAVVSIGAAVFVLTYLPQSDIFRAVADWCLHAIMPLVATHLSGHGLGHIAVVIPGLVLAASLIWALGSLLRGAASLWLRLKERNCVRGPLGSTVVPDREMLVAVPILGPARLVVSDRALATLDEGELRASLAHELGHLRRRHRPLLLGARLLAALARPLPGTRSAERELRFHLERDADAYAVALTRDPLALASAICKAACNPRCSTVAALGGSGRLGVRLEYLLDGQTTGSTRRIGWAVRGATGLLTAMLVPLVVTLPG